MSLRLSTLRGVYVGRLQGSRRLLNELLCGELGTCQAGAMVRVAGKFTREIPAHRPGAAAAAIALCRFLREIRYTGRSQPTALACTACLPPPTLPWPCGSHREGARPAA
eukprot:4070002-Prymnesium_polylepis.1